MIFAKHNFTDNFFSAVGYNDKFMESNIIIDEIARILVDDKKSVVDFLRSIGINVTYKDNNEYIKNQIVNEIVGENRKVIKFLADKIVKNQLDVNQLKEVAKKMKSADAQSDTKQPSKMGTLLNAIISDPNVQDSASTLISDSIKNAFSKNNSNSASNAQQLSERLKLNEMNAANQSQNKYTGLKIIGGIALAAGIGYVIYFFATKNSGSNTSTPAPVSTAS